MNEFDVLDRYLKPGQIVYDIGAHIGQLTHFFVKRGAKHVYAFEPSPNNFPHLQRNCAGLPVTLFRVALNDKEYECDTPFKDCRTDYFDEKLNKKMDTVQHISYVKLPSLIKTANLEVPDFIKMDIEGMESVVMNTFPDLLELCRPIVFVEIHAQAKDLDNQRYVDNPHWVYPEDGGFDFNRLKKLNYSIESYYGIRYNIDADWNPEPATHGAFILVPN